MKSILIIGMGRFGRSLSEKLLELGNDIMIVDKKEELINELAPRFTNALIGDATNLSVLKSLGVNNFDVCFVAIGENFQSSLEVTSQLKELGAKYVVSKASSQFDYLEISSEFGLFEIAVPKKWVGSTVLNTKARQAHNINIIAVKHGGSMEMLTGADYVFRADDHLVIIGRADDVFSLTNR